MSGRQAGASALEAGLVVLTRLREAPPRTLHVASIVRSSPLSPSVRAMLERREFGRACEASASGIPDVGLPGLDPSAGPVRFLAEPTTLDTLSRSVDTLLMHRKRLLAATVAADRPRRAVLLLGAGPGGLMTAVQLRLRDHQVVVCEPREAFTRNRFIGVYKTVAHLMAALGMPEDMTYDFTHYRGKRGMMLADIQTLLHAVALKLGVIIYTGAVVGNLTAETLRRGELELVRSTGSGPEGLPTVGMTRWQHDSVARVRSGVNIRFDTVVEASGGRSGLRELVVGPENVVALRVIARSAAARDRSLDSFFDDPDDHCAEFVESDYGCPPGLRTAYARALLDQFDELADELPCFVSNIDAAVLTAPVRATDRPVGLAAEIGEAALDVPPDWVVVQCPLPTGG